MEYRREEENESTTKPELQQAKTLDLKPSANGHLMEPIEAAWLLWGRRRLLIWLTTAGLVLATAIAFLLPKWYTATTRLMPPGFGSNSALALALPALGGGSTGGTGNSITSLAGQLLGLNGSGGELYVGVLGSRTIENHIIHEFGLMKLYGTHYPSVARKDLAASTDVGVDENSGIISISVTDKDPKRAAAIAKAYVEELNKVLARVNTSSAHRERVFLQKRLAKEKTQMAAAAKAFSEFASKNAAIDIPEQAKAMVTAAAELQGQLIAAQAQLHGLEQIYTPENSSVKTVKAQIAELQREIDKFGGKNVNPSTDATLGKNELYPSIRQLPLLGVKYLDLYRQNKIDEEVYELLTKEYEIARIEEARDLPTAEVLDPAVVPRKKSWPHRLYIMLGGMFFTFVLGAGWVVGRAMWNRVDPQQPWKVLSEEVYSTCMNHPVVARSTSLFRRNHRNGTDSSS